MMHKRLTTKLVAVLLLLATLLSVLPLSVLSAEWSKGLTPSDAGLGTVVVLHDGAEKSSITLEENGKEVLTALVNGVTAVSNTWQIRTTDGEQWVDIYGKNGETLDVTYTLVRSMLTDGGRAYLRHKVKDAEGAEYVSEPVEIVVSFDSTVFENAQVPSYGAAPSVTADEAEDETVETEDTELVSIVINYIFDNGGLAYEPYGASIAKGSPFKGIVVRSHDVTGYEPFRRVDILDETGAVVGSDYVSAEVVEFDLDAVYEDITINVIYEPAMVLFKVHHHFQNLEDDEYSLNYDRITEGYGLTGSRVPTNLTLDIAGFKALAYDSSITIAADGSTVVEIRYDRYYYLVTFNMAGGYGTDPVYTRYGSMVGANPPTKHGYVFEGWELLYYDKSAPTDEQKSM